MDVTVFTNTGCVSCQRAKAFLAQYNVSYTERSLATDSTAADELISGGFRMLPVIRVGSQAIEGFDPAALKKLLGI